MAQTAPSAAPLQGATVAPAPARNDFPPFDTRYWTPQIIWLAILFGALYLVLSRIALPRVGGIIENRRRRIDGDLRSAEDARRSAESERAAYERMLAEARARAQAEGREAHARAAAESDARRKALEADLNEKLAAADRQIDATKQRAMASVADIARDAVTPIVERLLGRTVDSAAVARALNEQEG